MRFSVVIPSYGRFSDAVAMRALIEAAEAIGYEGAWFADHVALPDYASTLLSPPMIEPLAACAWGSGFTERIKFGVDVLVAPYRHAVSAAATIASTAQLSGGRLVMGVGVGYMIGEFEALGLDVDDRGPRTDETLELWRALWEQPAPVTVRGERFSVDAVHPVGVPAAGFAPGAVPIWVGGNIGVAFRRAARLGDGWHPLFPTPEVYARGRAAIEAERARLGIDRPFTFSYSGPMGQLLDSPRDWSATAGGSAAAATARAQRPEFTYSPDPPRAKDGRPLLTGTPDEVIRDVGELADVGVEHLILRFWVTAQELHTDDVIRQYQRFADDVAPHFA